MPAYYNEIDPYTAEWLRNLISAGHIAPGDVDERSIEDVRPDDLRGYTQCHFFAGIGVWSYALRLAGWPDDRPVWTGSCPCQPFSAAGKGGGFADERHLWPAWCHLIGERRPPVVLGEQVASKDGLVWLDLVQADLEAACYAFGAVDTCSAGSGAPHIRQRLRFVAERVGDADRARTEVRLPEPTQREKGYAEVDDDGSDRLLRPDEGRSVAGGLGDTLDQSRERDARGVSGAKAAVDGAGIAVDGRLSLGPEHAGASVGGVAEPHSTGWQPRERNDQTTRHRHSAAATCSDDRLKQPGPVNGFWRDADWLFCRDGKWRPVEPGTSPLAHGAPARVGRLRAYGNAIDAQATKHFIEAYLDTERLRLTETSIMTTDIGVFG